MKTHIPEELRTILRNHRKWLITGNGEKADLSCANLSKADLSKANLSWANLHEADLSKANLSCANLSKADLSWVNLFGADLSGANCVTFGIDKYSGIATSTHVVIGCVRRPINEWIERDAAGTIGELDPDAERWWAIGRGVVMAAINIVKPDDCCKCCGQKVEEQS